MPTNPTVQRTPDDRHTGEFMPIVPAATTEQTVVLGNVHVNLVIADGAPVKLASVTAARTTAFGHAVTPLVELSIGGEGHVRHSHHVRHRNYSASHRLRFRSLDVTATAATLVQVEPASGLAVTTTIWSTSPDTVIITTGLRNDGPGLVVVDYLSSLVLGGFEDVIGDAVFERLRVHTAANSWTAEYRWADQTLEEFGIVDVGVPAKNSTSSARAMRSIGGLGSWSSATHMPVGAIEDRHTGTTWMWQLEHNGAWHAEHYDVGRDLALSLSGPTFRQNHWQTTIEPGGSFTSVPAALAVVSGDFTAAVGALTRHRRATRRKHPHYDALPIVANDYMNCLMGSPTTAALLPLVERAAVVGAEYFVVDAGWYSDVDDWWASVGEWKESSVRFPGGFREVFDSIRAHGMVPGLWVEPEVMGVDSAVIEDLPPEAFFRRNGQVITEHGRHQLDFRHPAVIEHMNAVIDRLIAEYGLGYLKFDYNINIGEGTDEGAVALGEGLLGHNRAFIRWLEGLLERHPTLVIENCASGGMRVDYAQLAVSQMQSTSDQEDPVLNAPIAAASPSVIAPDQAAVWSYPQAHYSVDLNDFTMTQSMLLRVHLGGRVDQLDGHQLARVATALGVNVHLRELVRTGTPFWPLGLPGWHDEWIALCLRSDDRIAVAVWRRPGASDTVTLPGLPAAVPSMLYPTDRGVTLTQNAMGLSVTIPASPGSAVFEWYPGRFRGKV